MCQTGRLSCCICAMLTGIAIYHMADGTGLAAGAAFTSAILTCLAMRWAKNTGENDSPFYQLLRISGQSLWMPLLAGIFIRTSDTRPISGLFITLLCAAPAAGLKDIAENFQASQFQGFICQACLTTLWLFIPVAALIFFSTRVSQQTAVYQLPLLFLIYIQLTYAELFHMVHIRLSRTPEDLNRLALQIQNAKSTDLRNTSQELGDRMYTNKRQLKAKVRNAIRAGKIYGTVAIVLITAVFFIRHTFPALAELYEPYAAIPVTLICIAIMVRLSILLRRSSQD